MNNLQLIKKYAPALAGVYTTGAKSSILDSGPELVRAGANANEILIPQLSLDGLADYSRNDAYVMGDIDLTWASVTFDYDRGRKFHLDAMDSEESGVSMGTGGEVTMADQTQQDYLTVSSAFMRRKVIPESDAFRFSRYASAAVAAGNTETAAYTDGSVLLAKLAAIYANMTDKSVPEDQRYLFITSTLHSLAANVDRDKNKDILDKFAGIIEVPSDRFVSAIDLLDGKTTGEEIGGYTKAAGALDLNFEVIHKPAVLQYIKHGVNKVIDPVQNQTSDGWLFFFRLYQLSRPNPGHGNGLFVSQKTGA